MFILNILSRLFIVTLTVITISNLNAYGNNPKLKQTVKFIEVEKVADDAKSGSVKILIKILPEIDITGSLIIKSNHNVSIIEDQKDLKEIWQTVSLSKNQLATVNLQFNQKTKYTGMFQIFFETPNAPVGYSRIVKKVFKFYNDGEIIHLIDPRDNYISTPKESGKDIFIEQGTTTTTTTYHVNINGRVKFYSVIDGYKGVYGNDVVLWFRNSSNPDEWYHPVYVKQQNVHYDVLDTEGNFNFDFSFDGDLSDYDELIVLLSTTNRATLLPVPDDGYIVWHDDGFSTYYNESEGIVVGIDGSQSDITVSQDIDFNSQDGAVFRFMMFARDMSLELYNDNMPFSLPAIQTQIKNISSAGVFIAEWDPINGTSLHIEIDPSATESTTITHEYGHFVNYQMWNNYSKFGAAIDDLKEGWAIHYSFSTRNYINKNFGDDLRDWDDNPKIPKGSEAEHEVKQYTGKRYSHDKPNNAQYSRWGYNCGSVRLGQQRIPIDVPRIYDNENNCNISLKSYSKLRELQEIDDRVLKAVLFGLSTRDYEPLIKNMLDSFGLSPSSVSKEFIEQSSAHLEAFENRSLKEYDFVSLFIDGKYLAKEQLITMLGG